MVDAEIHCVIDNGSGYMKAGFSGEESDYIYNISNLIKIRNLKNEKISISIIFDYPDYL